MKNKFIRLITLASVIASCITPAFAIEDDVPVPNRLLADEETVDNSRYKNIYELLSYLDIVTEDLDNLNTEKKVTRGEAAEFAARIKGKEVKAEQKPYADVELSNKNVNGIYTAKSFGILADGEKFYPNRAVTNSEIAEWMIKAIGNELIVYDGNYMNKAIELGIFDGVNSSESATPTLAELFVISENTLNAYVADVKLSGSDITLSLDEDANYLLKKYNIVLQKGIVTASGYSSIDKNILPGGKIAINAQEYEHGDEDITDFVGKAVWAYVDISDENYVVTIWENERLNNAVDIEFSDVKNVGKTEINYYNQNGREKRLKTEPSACVILNDIYYGNHEKAYVNDIYDDYKNILLIDNNGDDVYDIIKLYKPEECVVKLVSTQAESIIFKYDAGNIDLKEDNLVVKIYDGGKEVGLDALAENDILTILKGVAQDGTTVIKINVSHKKVTGVLKGIRTDNDRTYYTVDDKKYMLCRAYEEFLKNDSSETKPQNGSQCIFYLNADGEIAAAKVLGGYNYAFMQKVYFDEETEKGMIKLYTLDGEFKRYTMNEKVKLITPEMTDGKKLTANEICSRLGDTDGIIAYKTDANDIIISEIALAMDRTGEKTPTDTEYPLTKDYVCGNKSSPTEDSRLYTGMIGTLYGVSGVKTMTYPIEKDDRTVDKNFNVSSSATAGYGTDYYFQKEQVTLYNVDKFYVPEFVTIEKNEAKSNGIDSFNTPVMIAGHEYGLDSDNEPVQILSYYSNGALITKNFAANAEWFSSQTDYEWYGTEGDIDDLGVGDIVQFETNASGEIKLIRRLFKYKNAGEYRTQSGSDKGASEIKKTNPMNTIALIYGKVSDRSGSYVNIDLKSGSETASIIIPNYISSLYGRVSYTVFNKETKTVSNAGMEDILPGDTVVLRKRYNTVCDVFIYR